MNPQPKNDAAPTNADEPDDEALMEALQHGDEHALSRLMLRWETAVKMFLLRLGVPGSDVEDVAQETFMRLYKKRAAYRAGAAFKPWILSIAANLGRDHLRWRWRRRRREESLAGRDWANAEFQADARNDVAKADIGRLVRASVAALPEKLRRAVVCVDLEDMSHNEAARAMGCTSKATEARLRRGRELLRQRLAAVLAREQAD